MVVLRHFRSRRGVCRGLRRKGAPPLLLPRRSSRSLLLLPRRSSAAPVDGCTDYPGKVRLLPERKLLQNIGGKDGRDKRGVIALVAGGFRIVISAPNTVKDTKFLTFFLRPRLQQGSGFGFY